MKRFTRKSISVLLSLLLMLSVCTGLAFVASAEDPTEWTTSNSLPSSAGSYKLMTDVALSNTWYPVDGTTLDLNGYKITSSGNYDHFVVLQNGITFTLNDSKKDSTDPADKHYYSISSQKAVLSDSETADYFIGGCLYGINRPSSSVGGAVYVEAGGNFVMNGGTILGHRYLVDGGGVFVRGKNEEQGLPDGVFTMNDGSIIGNHNRWGAGVYNQGVFNLNGGSIRQNYSDWGGGAVLNHGTTNMNGGSISNNGSIGVAGICVFIGTLNLNGGEIVNNASSRDEGGVGGGGQKNISGNPVVTGNTSVGSASNFVPSQNNPIGITAPLTGTQPINITLPSGMDIASGAPFVLTSGWDTYMEGADPNDFFTFDNASWRLLTNANGELQIVDPSKSYFTASFDAGEGSGNMESITAAVLTLPENDFTAPIDKLFAGWLSSADEAIYAPGTNVTLRDDITYTAQWSPAVTVSFDTEGGNAVASQIIPQNTTATEPTAPVRSGFIFRGWRLDGTIYDFSEPVAADMTLHAVWIEGVSVEETFGSSAPDGWTAEGEWRFTTSGYNGSETTQAHSGEYMAYHPYYSSSRLNMPVMDLSGQSAASLRFWYQNCFYGSSADNLIVSYRVNGGEWVELFRTTEEHKTWTEATVALPAEALQTNVEIGFYADVNGGWGVFLDDVALVGSSGHNLTYSAADNVLTANCSNDPCAFEDGKLELTLNAPAKTVYGDENSPAATLTDLGKFNVELDLAISEDDIVYYSGETQLDAAPTDAGSYTASLTVAINDTDYTITKDYTIAKIDPTYEVPAGLTAHCGDTLESVSLPAGWTWNDPTTPVDCVGADALTKTVSYAATFTPDDTTNYNNATADLTLTVSHAYKNHEAQAPTCTEIGWDAYQTCENCDYSTYVEIPATGHAYVNHDAKAPTCTEIGWEAYQTCENCDYTSYVEIPATGNHVYGTIGAARYTCRVCGTVDAQRKAAFDQAAAADVIALIDAIGEVKDNDTCHQKILTAREAYDKLTDVQKALVTNYATLQQAEARYYELTELPCKYCGEIHDSSLGGGFIAIWHSILYFFAHLFGKK